MIISLYNAKFIYIKNYENKYFNEVLNVVVVKSDPKTKLFIMLIFDSDNTIMNIIYFILY